MKVVTQVTRAAAHYRTSINDPKKLCTVVFRREGQGVLLPGRHLAYSQVRVQVLDAAPDVLEHRCACPHRFGASGEQSEIRLGRTPIPVIRQLFDERLDAGYTVNLVEILDPLREGLRRWRDEYRTETGSSKSVSSGDDCLPDQRPTTPHGHVVRFENDLHGVGDEAKPVPKMEKYRQNEFGILCRLSVYVNRRRALTEKRHVIQVHEQPFAACLETLLHRQHHSDDRRIQSRKMEAGWIYHMWIVVVVDGKPPRAPRCSCLGNRIVNRVFRPGDDFE